MTRYSQSEKEKALAIVQRDGYKIAVRETKISEPTLRRWMAATPKSADELRGELLDLAFELIDQLRNRIPTATDRDLYRALQVSVQQLTALAKAIPPDTSNEPFLRIEYVEVPDTLEETPYRDADGKASYPKDGSIPPWEGGE